MTDPVCTRCKGPLDREDRKRCFDCRRWGAEHQKGRMRKLNPRPRRVHRCSHCYATDHNTATCPELYS